MRAIGRPERKRSVPRAVKAELAKVCAIRVYHPDLVMTDSIRGKRDSLSVRRPCRMGDNVGSEAEHFHQSLPSRTRLPVHGSSKKRCVCHPESRKLRTRPKAYSVLTILHSSPQPAVETGRNSFPCRSQKQNPHHRCERGKKFRTSLVCLAPALVDHCETFQSFIER
jgi:hypothetical protein